MTAQDIIGRFQHWASSYYPQEYAILDTETTALDGEIVELAIVNMRGNVLFNERIRPQGPVSAAAFAVHGISTADLARCEDFAYWWPQIRSLLSEYNILVYNKRFDFNVLYNSLSAVRPNWWHGEEGATDPYSADYHLSNLICRHAECVMLAYAPLAGDYNEYYGSYSWAKLTEACQQRGVDVSDLQAHSALGDTQATARLIQAVAQCNPAQFPWLKEEDEG